MTLSGFPPISAVEQERRSCSKLCAASCSEPFEFLRSADLRSLAMGPPPKQARRRSSSSTEDGPAALERPPSPAASESSDSSDESSDAFLAPAPGRRPGLRARSSPDLPSASAKPPACPPPAAEAPAAVSAPDRGPLKPLRPLNAGPCEEGKRREKRRPSVPGVPLVVDLDGSSDEGEAPPTPSCRTAVDRVWRAALAAAAAAPAGAEGRPSLAMGLAVLRSLSGLVGRSRPARPDGLPYSGYEAFHLALHRALCPPRSPWRLEDGRQLARENWSVDGGGREAMPRAAFETALRGAAASWASDVARTNVATGMRLLAAEAGLDGLESVFLSCLADTMLLPGGPPRLRPWYDVEVGGCSTAAAMQHLARLAPHRPRSLPALPRPAPCAAPAAPAAPAGLEEGGRGPHALRRRALHNRMERLLEARQAALPKHQ